MNTDKTIKVEDGVQVIYVYDDKDKRQRVFRLSRRKQDKCQHKWGWIGRPGHGNWRCGCLLCGALGR